MSDGLTNKQRRFIDEYLVDFNATQAAIRCGYSSKTAGVIGCENLKKPNIAEAIKKKIEENAMSAEEIILRLSDIARGNISDLMSLSTMGYHFKLTTEDEEGNLIPNPKNKLIKRIKQKVTTITGKDEEKEIIETDLELLDQQAALNTLAKYRGLLIDRHELTGRDGGAIPIEVFEKAVSKVYGESG